MKQLITFALLGGLAAAAAVAEERHVCQLADLTRIISVEYEQPGEPVPCRVRYEKVGESVTYPWNAQGQEGYCEARVTEFVAKHGGRGWECALQAADAMGTEKSQ